MTRLRTLAKIDRRVGLTQRIAHALREVIGFIGLLLISAVLIVLAVSSIIGNIVGIKLMIEFLWN